MNINIPAAVRAFMDAHAPYSYAPISKYRIAVVGEAAGFDLIPGVNVEFPGVTLNETIHAEQCVIAIAHARRIPKLDTIYIDRGAPCGHCRQVLNELMTELAVWTDGDQPRALSSLLPFSFGPRDLGVEGGLLASKPHRLKCCGGSTVEDAAAELAIDCAARSYAPYSRAYAGVVFTLHDNRLCPGSYLENAAMNPTLSPFHSAICNLVAGFEASFEEIRKVTLAAVAGSSIDHLAPIERLLRSINVDCPIETHLLETAGSSGLRE